MTQPVYNMNAPIAKIRGGFAYLISPWNSLFQQFAQQAPDVAGVAASPFTANSNGTVIFTGGSPVITLTRGDVNIILTGQRIIPISVGDTVSWSGATTVQFLGA